MADAQKQMNAPENQAKMKELEAQMNDPKMKAMMESNPEMKAMIEKQMAMMKGGGNGSVMDGMMPKGMEIKIKGNNSHTMVLGGAMETEVLYLGANDKSYHLDRANKTYTVSEGEKGDGVAKYTITKTEEFANVLGFKCRKYIVETAEHGQKINNFVWTTTEIKDIDVKQMSKMKINGKSGSFMEKLEGVPMKMQMVVPGQGSMNMEVTSVKNESLAASLFQMPAGFTEKKK